MTDYNEKYTEEINLLFKALRTDGFRFVIVKYNHYSLVQKLKADVENKFPTRSSFTIDAEKTDYKTFVESYYNLKEGFFFVENFDKILENPELYAGINQRRDKLANYPIALIAFISPSAPVLYARQIMEKMPDLWSFRSLMIELEKEQVKSEKISLENILEHNIKISSLGGNTREEKITELERLENVLKTIDRQNDTSLLESVLEQKATLQTDLGRYNEAIETLDLLISIVSDKEIKSKLLVNKGRIYVEIGHYEKALRTHKKSFGVANNLYSKGNSLFHIGNTYLLIGNYSEALKNIKKSNKILEKLNKQERNKDYMKALCYSYQITGLIFLSTNKNKKSKDFFERFNDLANDIYKLDNSDVEIMVFLASYYQYTSLIELNEKNFEIALYESQRMAVAYEFFLVKVPNNITLQVGYILSYDRMADINSFLGNFSESLILYEKAIEIIKKFDLFDLTSQSANIIFAITSIYYKLGYTQLNLGKINQSNNNLQIARKLIISVISKNTYLKYFFENRLNDINEAIMKIQNLKA
ncbi:tetratricopeptide repeat protein [Bernardetia sp. MNP-M8]|uniref:tetratricopeptide repeat protein n=1 Tax=Bernardetia sp. MNP-M8 TaxID=3127470 RepID=UPI0030CB3642